MTAQATPKGAWKITFLLFLFMLVNFADKIVVGLAGVPIMDELKLSPEQFGFLGSSFFFPVFDLGLVVGFIANRIDTRWVLLVMAVIWSISQFPMVGTVSFTTLADLPHHSRRRRRAGVRRGSACDLQMVSRREAHVADRHSFAGVGVRCHSRSAGAELDHRQS